MRTGSDIFRFGPFELDSADRRLMRGRQRIPIHHTLFDMLLLFVSHPGEILSNDALWEAGWKGTAVTPNNVTQAVKRLRKALGLQKDRRAFIENVHKHGYRFAAPVTREQPRQRNVAVDALIAPFMLFLKARAWLETLDLAAVRRALLVFEEAIGLAPDHASAHIGLASACAMLFESTRTDAVPDLPVLQRAHVHARRACELDEFSADAWSTLAFVLHRLGHRVRRRDSTGHGIRPRLGVGPTLSAPGLISRSKVDAYSTRCPVRAVRRAEPRVVIWNVSQNAAS